MEATHENLGSLLLGETMQNTPYDIAMSIPENCKILCKRTMNKFDINNFMWMIEREYKVNL